MRFLHTSDWHLGHTIRTFARDREHDAFLDWLLGTLDREQVDALLITGDIFDTANPSGAAQRMWYRFLERAHRQNPALVIVVIGGNHDSASRLDAPEPLLRTHNVHVVGGLPLLENGDVNVDRLVVELKDRSGAVRALCAAVPFLRPCDLPVLPDAADPLRAGVEAIYRQVLEGLKARRKEGQAMIVTGHLYLTGTRLSDMSERKILGGNLHALESSLFPDELAYVALGHLHFAQIVGNRDTVRYAGSPLPLDVTEVDYDHQVCLVDLEGEQVSEVRTLSIPRTVEIVTIPKKGAATPEAVEEMILALPARDDAVDPELRPYLHVKVNRRVPDYWSRLERLLEGKAPRLVKFAVEEEGRPAASPADLEAQVLEMLKEEDVFRRCYEQTHGEVPPPEVMAAFFELVEEARRIERGAE